MMLSAEPDTRLPGPAGQGAGAATSVEGKGGRWGWLAQLEVSSSLHARAPCWQVFLLCKANSSPKDKLLQGNLCVVTLQESCRRTF